MDKQLNNIDKGFTSIYEQYELIDNDGIVAKWMRKKVHYHIERHLKKDNTILEINAGSGIDAIHFAKKGFKVFATDISEGFVSYFSKKVEDQNLESKIEYQKLSFNELYKIENRKFNYIFSNFGGLNCTNNLDQVFNQFDDLLEEDGKVSLVVMPKITPWEWLWFYKSFKNAFRRLTNKPVTANIESHQVLTWYHSVSKVKNIFQHNYKVIEVENIAFFSPTGVNDDFAIKFPKTYNFLLYLEQKLGFILPKGIGDYYIITLQKIKN